MLSMSHHFYSVQGDQYMYYRNATFKASFIEADSDVHRMICLIMTSPLSLPVCVFHSIICDIGVGALRAHLLVLCANINFN